MLSCYLCPRPERPFPAFRMTAKPTYTIEISFSNADAWRYNLLASVATLDAQRSQKEFSAERDEIIEVGGDASSADRSKTSRKIKLQASDGEYMVLCIYVIANTLPQSNSLEESKELKLSVKVSEKSRTIYSKRLDVNPWSGLNAILEIPLANLAEKP